MPDELISAVLEEVIGSTGNHLMRVFFLSQKTKQIHINDLQFEHINPKKGRLV